MKSNRTALNIIIATLILVGVCILSVGITLLATNSSHSPSTVVADTAAAYDTAVQDWTGNQETYTGEKNTDSISIPGFDFLNFKADTGSQAVNFYNPPANNCYFKISLLLNEETLWMSPILAPGKAVYAIDMNRALTADNYHATLKYECFADEQATKALNGSEVGIVLKVLD